MNIAAIFVNNKIKLDTMGFTSENYALKIKSRAVGFNILAFIHTLYSGDACIVVEFKPA